MGPEVLRVEQRPDPVAGPGQIRVAVHAAGINFADLMARAGIYPDAPSPPGVVGYEVAGGSTASATAPGSRVGDRVIAGTRFGGYAELVAVDAGQAIALPEALDFEQGGVRGQLRDRLRGARRHGRAEAGRTGADPRCRGGRPDRRDPDRGRNPSAIFTASAAKHDAIRAQGSSDLIDYRNTDFAAEAMRASGGTGLDLIIDALGPSSFRKDYRILRAGGRLVMYGLAEVQTGEKRDLPALLRARPDAAGDVAVVEESADDEREQGRLRPQPAQVVG